MRGERSGAMRTFIPAVMSGNFFTARRSSPGSLVMKPLLNSSRPPVDVHVAAIGQVFSFLDLEHSPLPQIDAGVIGLHGDALPDRRPDRPWVLTVTRSPSTSVMSLNTLDQGLVRRDIVLDQHLIARGAGRLDQMCRLDARVPAA